MAMAIFCAGSTKAVEYAAEELRQLGHCVTQDEAEATHLLLDVPSLNAARQLRSGGSPASLLDRFSRDVVLCGGNLDAPILEGYKRIDLLKDETYLAHNAYLTAEAALDVATGYLPVTVRNCPTLICGWGRIGKCLSLLLRDMGADVTVAVRSAKDRAALRSMGFQTADISGIRCLHRCRLIFNTVPHPVLTQEQLTDCPGNCVKIDLASTPGMSGPDIIHATGLPGLHLPESSGKLIATRLDDYLKKEVSP